jgi:hypothetical protein
VEFLPLNEGRAVRYRVYLYRKFSKEFEELARKDITSFKKMLAALQRLTERLPNKPEMWESIKGCEVEVYELKVKPYRVCCLKVGDNLLALTLWRVQKNSSRKKRENIKKCCQKAKEVLDGFKRAIKRI